MFAFTYPFLVSTHSSSLNTSSFLCKNALSSSVSKSSPPRSPLHLNIYSSASASPSNSSERKNQSHFSNPLFSLKPLNAPGANQISSPHSISGVSAASTSTIPSVTTTTSSSTPQKRSGPAPFINAEGDTLENTPSQIFIGCLMLVLVAINFTMALVGITKELTPVNMLLNVFAAIAGFYFADFAAGVYHWALDNYGDENTPVFGFQAASFQGHHISPWTITSRPMFNNISKACLPFAPLILILTFLNLSPSWRLFWTMTMGLFAISQEFHKWAHMTNPPPYAKVLQSLHISLPRKMHGTHHTDPFHRNYCIISGVCNWFLDKIEFFRRLEAFFYRLFGSEPICWKLEPSLKEKALSL